MPKKYAVEWRGFVMAKDAADAENIVSTAIASYHVESDRVSCEAEDPENDDDDLLGSDDIVDNLFDGLNDD